MGSFYPSDGVFSFKSAKSTSLYHHISAISFLFGHILFLVCSIDRFCVCGSVDSILWISFFFLLYTSLKAFFISYLFFFTHHPHSSSMEYSKLWRSIGGTFAIYFCSIFGLDLHSGVHFKFFLQRFSDQRFCVLIASISYLAYSLLILYSLDSCTLIVESSFSQSRSCANSPLLPFYLALYCLHVRPLSKILPRDLYFFVHSTTFIYKTLSSTPFLLSFFCPQEVFTLWRTLNNVPEIVMTHQLSLLSQGLKKYSELSREKINLTGISLLIAIRPQLQ